MYAGRIVERAPVRALFAQPQHPYTIGLLGSIPQLHLEQERLAAIEGQVPNAAHAGARLPLPSALPVRRSSAAAREEPPLARRRRPATTPRAGARRCRSRWIAPHDGHRGTRSAARARTATPLLRVDGLVKHFPVRRGLLRRATGVVHAVDGVSFDVAVGETLGARRRIGLRQVDDRPARAAADRADGGRVRVRRRRPRGAVAGRDARAARALQIIFQDPFASLNPRMTVGQTLAEPLALHGLAEGRRRERVAELLRPRRPRRRSTRAAIRTSSPAASGSASASRARSRSSRGSSSATSRSPRSTCRSRRRSSTCCATCSARLGLTYLFIAHDLAVVKHIATASP